MDGDARVGPRQFSSASSRHGPLTMMAGVAPIVVALLPCKLYYQHGALGSGSQANASIGRAVKLVLQNVGGARLGGSESTALGTPMKFTLCVAEWEQRLDMDAETDAWEQYHTM
jgi:hypothetical protein